MAHKNGKPALKGVAAKLPTTKEGVAALGLQTAVRLATNKTGLSTEQILLDLSLHVDCALFRIHQYHDKTGVPYFRVDAALEYFKGRGVRIGRHQLAPTKAVLSGYGIYE